jgi:glycosyltransferase involved in cell wall biosynthesis
MDSNPGSLAKIDIIIPLYNEEVALPAFYKMLCGVIDNLTYEFNLCFVNDG